MKHLANLIALALLSSACYAQNTFPSSGNVGVGTTSPTEKLEVIGNVKAASFIGTASSSNMWGGQFADFTTGDYSISHFATMDAAQDGKFRKSSIANVKYYLGIDNGTILNNNISGSANLWNGNGIDKNVVYDSGLYYLSGFDYGSASTTLRMYNQTAIRNWLGMPGNGETLQSITERGTTTTNGATFGNDLIIDKNFNGESALSLINSNSGTTAYSLNQLTNGSSALQLFHTGTNFSANGVFKQNGSTVNANGSGGLNLAAASGIFINQFNTAPTVVGTGGLAIGKTNPTELLDVAGNVLSFKLILDEMGTRSWSFTPQSGGLNFKSGDGNGQFNFDNNIYTKGLKLDENGIRLWNIVPGGGNLSLVGADGGGFVGIGTTTPKEKLSVNGKIRAHEIKVEATNWPDYVFEDGYQMSSLTGLEEFIKINKHLPGVPTAKSVAEQGIELGKMNQILLQKIEELTLHLIEKEKELSREKEKNKSQDNRLSKLEEMVFQKNK